MTTIGRILVMVVSSGLFIGPVGLRGQSGEVRLDLGFSRSFPPAGADAIEASYAMAGLSLEKLWADGSGFGVSAMGGRALTDFGSDWASVQAVGEIWGTVTNGVEVGLGARGSAFRVGLPFVYETNTGELFPQVRLTRDRWVLLLRGEVGSGDSYFAFHRPDGGVRRANPELWERGGTAELSALALSGLITAGAGFYRGVAGDYSRLFAGYSWSGPVFLRAGAEVWDTPTGQDVSATLSMEVAVGRWLSFRAQGGRSEPDPLIRTPQGRHGGSLLGVRLVDLGAAEVPRVVTVDGTADGGGYRVTFVVPSDGSKRVHLLGDFSSWEPMPLQRIGEKWVIDLVLESGVYHFGFEIDGTWMLPEGTPGVVADDWGTENGTLVVPGAEL